MSKELPIRPSLEHLKTQAKDLLDAYRHQDAAASERFLRHLPAAAHKSAAELAQLGLALHDAQSVIAREYGFPSFAELRAHVERVTAEPELLRDLMRKQLNLEPPAQVLAALASASARDAGSPASRAALLDPWLPLIPLRNALLPAGAVGPLRIERPSSLAAVEAVRNGSGVLAIFTQKDFENEAPGVEDLHPVGCAAELLEVIEEPPGVWIVVRAAAWIRLAALERTTPYLGARVTPFAVQEERDANTERLEQALRQRVRSMIAALPQAQVLLARTESMSALELADATIANLGCSVADKARYATEPRLAARLELVLELSQQAA